MSQFYLNSAATSVIPLTGGSTQNLGINYDIGTATFTVRGATGLNLSAANPAFVNIQSKTPGNQITIRLTANQDFIDGRGATQIALNLFGLTTSIATTVDIPFFLYACLNDAETTVTFGISRIPHMSISPVAANIGTPALAAADTQGSLFLFDSVTVADYESNPVLCVGSFRMRMDALDDWEVVALSVGQDGIGLFQDNQLFVFPRGQFGAAVNKWFADNGGTAPDQAVGSSYGYYVHRNGFCLAKMAMPNVTISGVGAGNLTQVLPYYADGSAITNGVLNGAGNIIIFDGACGANNSPLVNVNLWSGFAGQGTLQNGSVLAGYGYTSDGYYFISKA